MLSPLTQASPFPIELKFKANGALPSGASKNVYRKIHIRELRLGNELTPHNNGYKMFVIVESR